MEFFQHLISATAAQAPGGHRGSDFDLWHYSIRQGAVAPRLFVASGLAEGWTERPLEAAIGNLNQEFERTARCWAQ